MNGIGWCIDLIHDDGAVGISMSIIFDDIHVDMTLSNVCAVISFYREIYDDAYLKTINTFPINLFLYRLIKVDSKNLLKKSGFP